MQDRGTQDVIEIDLREVFFQLLNHWKMLVISTVTVGVIAFVISFFILTPQYEATSELYVLSKSTSITSLADIQMGSNLTNDYIVVVKGRPILEQVITTLGLEENYEELEKKITLENPADSRILQITVRDENAYRAKHIADEIAEVSSAFISEKMDQDPPTIIQYGYADGEPVSPNVFRNTAVGALLGAMLAAAIVIVSYLLNDTIMAADDVERKLGLNLLGALPAEAEEEELDKNRKKRRVTKLPEKKQLEKERA